MCFATFDGAQSSVCTIETVRRSNTEVYGKNR